MTENRNELLAVIGAALNDFAERTRDTIAFQEGRRASRGRSKIEGGCRVAAIVPIFVSSAGKFSFLLSNDLTRDVSRNLNIVYGGGAKADSTAAESQMAEFLEETSGWFTKIHLKYVDRDDDFNVRWGLLCKFLQNSASWERQVSIGDEAAMFLWDSEMARLGVIFLPEECLGVCAEGSRVNGHVVVRETTRLEDYKRRLESSSDARPSYIERHNYCLIDVSRFGELISRRSNWANAYGFRHGWAGEMQSEILWGAIRHIRRTLESSTEPPKEPPSTTAASEPLPV